MSLTVVGLIGMIVSYILTNAGISWTQEEVDEFAGHIMTVIGILGFIISTILAWYRRWTRGDINALGIKSKPLKGQVRK